MSEFIKVPKTIYNSLFKIAEDLSLAVDEYGQSIGTHYIQHGRIMPKGSFIKLVEDAKNVVDIIKN